MGAGSWKLERPRAGRAGTRRRAGKFPNFGEAGNFWKSWKRAEAGTRYSKLEASWKILDAKYMNKYSASWKLDKLELYSIRAGWKFKIIKFIFINKFLFLFNFKKLII